MRRPKQSGRNQTDRSEQTEGTGLKIKTLPALREALKQAADNGVLPKVAEHANVTTDAYKQFMKGDGQLANGLRGRTIRALEAV